LHRVVQWGDPSAKKDMLSLNARLLIAASIVLAAFLGLTGLALDRAFRESALSATWDRLYGQSLLLLSAAELHGDGIVIPADLPEARYSSPASGLFAEVVSGTGDTLWRSPSSLGLELDYPKARFDGDSSFAQRTTADGDRLFTISFGVTWELDDGGERQFEFRVAEDASTFETQVANFRASLWLWFSAAALLLLLIQALILRWGLAPLRRVAKEVRQVEAGERDKLADDYPHELHQLTSNLNELLGDGRRRLERYRNAIDDLAHSLKTPLAVLRNVAVKQSHDDDLRTTVREEVERMDRTVSYQLQRAAASGKMPLSTPVDVEAVARRLCNSLSKVYADKKLQFDVIFDGGVFRGDEGDLMEILGNLMDNACKWAESTVRVRFASEAGDGQMQRPLTIDVDDDGPGFVATDVHEALRRGVRSSTEKAGQGIGLAVVRELVEDLYGGRVEIGQSDSGGARVRLGL
jgi:two-component system sensor histidine kinase PhoQ